MLVLSDAARVLVIQSAELLRVSAHRDHPFRHRDQPLRNMILAVDRRCSRSVAREERRALRRPQ